VSSDAFQALERRYKETVGFVPVLLCEMDKALLQTRFLDIVGLGEPY